MTVRDSYNQGFLQGLRAVATKLASEAGADPKEVEEELLEALTAQQAADPAEAKEALLSGAGAVDTLPGRLAGKAQRAFAELKR